MTLLVDLKKNLCLTLLYRVITKEDTKPNFGVLDRNLNI